MIAQCENCPWTGSPSELEPIRHLDQRVLPGEPMPLGQCPKCGALAHGHEEVRVHPYAFGGPETAEVASSGESKKSVAQECRTFYARCHEPGLSKYHDLSKEALPKAIALVGKRERVTTRYLMPDGLSWDVTRFTDRIPTIVLRVWPGEESWSEEQLWSEDESS